MTYFFSAEGRTIEILTGTDKMKQKKARLLEEEVFFTIKDTHKNIVFTNE